MRPGANYEHSLELLRAYKKVSNKPVITKSGLMVGLGEEVDEILAVMEIVEASPTDRVWGVGIAIDDERIWDMSRWRGLNLLGIALTQVREALRWSN